jgi:hypothetical protein
VLGTDSYMCTGATRSPNLNKHLQAFHSTPVGPQCSLANDIKMAGIQFSLHAHRALTPLRESSDEQQKRISTICPSSSHVCPVTDASCPMQFFPLGNQTSYLVLLTSRSQFRGACAPGGRSATTTLPSLY